MAQNRIIPKINSAEFETFHTALKEVNSSKKYVSHNGFTFHLVDKKYEKNLCAQRLTSYAQSAFAYIEEDKTGTSLVKKRNYQVLEEALTGYQNKLVQQRSTFAKIMEFVFGYVFEDRRTINDLIKKVKQRADELNETTGDISEEYEIASAKALSLIYENLEDMRRFNGEYGTLENEIAQIENALIHNGCYVSPKAEKRSADYAYEFRDQLEKAVVGETIPLKIQTKTEQIVLEFSKADNENFRISYKSFRDNSLNNLLQDLPCLKSATEEKIIIDQINFNEHLRYGFLIDLFNCNFSKT